jgi:hypothetical protein
MKFCKDCTHYRTENLGYTVRAICAHPDNAGGVDLVSGNRVGGIDLCGTVRADLRRCGPSAQWFDPATLDAKLEMLDDNTKTVYLTSGEGHMPKAYAFRSTAEKQKADGQIITPIEFWDKQ